MMILIVGMAIVGIALGAAGALWAQDYWRQRKAPRELKPILDWRPTLRMDARATAQAELSEDDNVPANWTLQAEEIRLVESVGGYPHVEIRWRPATRREVRDFVSTYQRIRADEIKERMNKLYASDINVGYFDVAKADGGRRVLSLTDNDRGTGNHIETSAGEGEPGAAPLIPEVAREPAGGSHLDKRGIGPGPSGKHVLHVDPPHIAAS
jgi:hypothetical protein